MVIKNKKIKKWAVEKIMGYEYKWEKSDTYLQVLSLLPGGGGPQAILRPRQNKQAR